MSLPQFSMSPSSLTKPKNLAVNSNDIVSTKKTVLEIQFSKGLYQNIISSMVQVSVIYEMVKGSPLGRVIFTKFQPQILAHRNCPKPTQYLVKLTVDQYLSVYSDTPDLQLLADCAILALEDGSSDCFNSAAISNIQSFQHSRDEILALTRILRELKPQVSGKTPYCYLAEACFPTTISETIEDLIDYSLLLWTTVDLTAKETFLVCLHLFLEKNAASQSVAALPQKLLKCKDAIKQELIQDLIY